MSSSSCALPSGTRFVNPESGLIIDIPPGYQPVAVAPETTPPAAVPTAADAATSEPDPGSAHLDAAATVPVADSTPANQPSIVAPPSEHLTGNAPAVAALPAADTTPANQPSPAAPPSDPLPGNAPAAVALPIADSTPVNQPSPLATVPSTAADSDHETDPFSAMTCYAPIDGPVSKMHETAIPSDDGLEYMEVYQATCAQSQVSRMVFRSDAVVLKMDTRETLRIPPGIEHLAGFLRLGKAAAHLVLVFATKKFDVINVDPRLWATFTRTTTFVAISGTVHSEEIRRLLPSLENVVVLNILNQSFLGSGCLNDFSRFIPPSVTHFMFDTRCTSNSTLIENVMALYGDLYMRKRDSKPCFKKLLLVVTDFCQRRALAVQLQRVADMLLDDCSTASILTTCPADDGILDLLLSHMFKRGRPGYLANIDRCYEKFEYWETRIDGKLIILGFRDPAVAPIPEVNGVLL